jgi:hypothetical protein
VPGEGYRFDGLANVLASVPASGARVAEFHPDAPGGRADRATMVDESTIAARRYATGPPRLSIVVLPFANIGGGAEQEHFVNGVPRASQPIFRAFEAHS